MLEQAETVTEEYGHYVYLYFVDKSGPQALLCGIRAADDCDVFVTCRYLCLLYRAFHTVCDKGNGQPFVLSFCRLLRDVMSDDEYRRLKFVIREIPRCHVVGVPSH